MDLLKIKKTIIDYIDEINCDDVILKAENESIKAENNELKIENEMLKNKIDELNKLVDGLRQDVQDAISGILF